MKKVLGAVIVGSISLAVIIGYAFMIHEEGICKVLLTIFIGFILISLFFLGLKWLEL
jgi:hypothetical protein